MSRDYRKLVAWNRAHALTLAVYKFTMRFPVEERYGMVRQMRRAIGSVAANIAEGSGRESNREYLHFLSIAHGSLKEAEYFLLLARDLGYLHDADHASLTAAVNGTFAALHGLKKAVKREV